MAAILDEQSNWSSMNLPVVTPHQKSDDQGVWQLLSNWQNAGHWKEPSSNHPILNHKKPAKAFVR
jgi:hypothetical protein